MTPPKLQPEQEARAQIDEALEAAGWIVQSREEKNLYAGQGVAVREFKMKHGHGVADYLLFVDRQAVGALEAKKVGTPLSGVEAQVRMYGDGLPSDLKAPHRPLPFLYTSTGIETRFTNRLDPRPRSRKVFAPHRPETLAEWLRVDPYARRALAKAEHGDADDAAGASTAADAGPGPVTVRRRLRAMPPPEIPGLWNNQIAAIAGLERSLAEDRPRTLIQMATGSGKSKTAVAAAYRLIKFGGARRILFLVDRTNLGEQIKTEFDGYTTYDDNRKLPELYGIQRLTGDTVGVSSKVVISTIQRLYALLRGEPLAEEAEQASPFDADGGGVVRPVEVGYSARIPPETFDFIFIDECHRSIYSLWCQVLEYFDAHLIGLTATPAKHTFGFFDQNLVMEYTHEQAVADGVNVEYDVYRIRTQITEQGSTVEAGPGVMVKKRDRMTRALRWEQPDEDVTYTAEQLDRDVVAKGQIRLVVRTFRERLFTEIFPGRRIVPKTLVFAKDDSHAEDIVEMFRQEFGESDEFCQKITYKVTQKKPKDLLADFRTKYYPRVAVTVDMIATGTDVKPIEIVMFMRSVKSRVLYDQMKGRGVRSAGRDEMQAVTTDASAKTHFVVVDCVGVTETPMQDRRPLERKPGVSLKALLDHVGNVGEDLDVYASLASRLVRLDQRCDADERRRIADAAGGVGLRELAKGLATALDADVQEAEARGRFGLAAGQEPTDAQMDEVARALVLKAAEPLARAPKLRDLLVEIKRQHEQIIDEMSHDVLLEAGVSERSGERARALVQSFEQYIAEHKDEIDALQFFYSQPYGRRLRYEEIEALARAIEAPPRQWTPERLWRAYEQLDESKVRGAAKERLLTDVVSLVRYALHQEDELVPYAEQVRGRFESWMAQQGNRGRTFTAEQVRWLEMIRDHVAQSLELEVGDFELTPFVEEGGLGRASKVFGKELGAVVRELNEVLSA